MRKLKVLLLLLAIISFPTFVYYLWGLNLTYTVLNSLADYKLKKIKIINHETSSQGEGGYIVLVNGIIDNTLHEKIQYGTDEKEFLRNLPKDSVMELWLNEKKPDIIWAESDHVLSRERLEQTFNYRLRMSFIFPFFLISYLVIFFYSKSGRKK